MNNTSRNILFWVGIGLFLMFVFNMLQQQGGSVDGASKEVAYSSFMSQAQDGHIASCLLYTSPSPRD